MNLAFSLSEIQLVLPTAETPRVISALREDAVVWSALPDPDLIKRAIAYCNDNPKKWNPGILALLALSKPYEFGEMSEGLVEFLAVKYKSTANDKLEEFIRDPGLILNIEDAGILALAIREKFLRQGSWEEVVDWLSPEINITDQKISSWHTIFACLYGIIEKVHPNSNNISYEL